MKLSQYPALIDQAAQAVNDLDRQILDLRQDIAALEGKAEVIVAFESTLKNDNQRKARRFEILQENDEYQQLLGKLVMLTSQKSNGLSHLEYLRNQFSVAKLEARWAIAEKLVGLESRELVGL
ncbi:hypothetical protein H6F67_24380 [Microcoleus sp. FACHB-1515]|uniref:hypothetical protein n=1 Tax=Cyanophyceae TaxID=3028117 RepID=UPI001688C23A|nr:hypothetical protein [Microcoleus sp. FACHB-1515]MBD2092989.1 hypothetical protein [Microcoleus sp. FACHB-1515]